MFENHSSGPMTPPEAESEAFVRLCEVLEIPATSCAYLEGARLVTELQNTRAQLAFVLEHGLPMKREGKYRYHGIAEPVWQDNPLAAIRAAMPEFPASPEDVEAPKDVAAPPGEAATELSEAVDAIIRIPLCGSEGKLLIERTEEIVLWAAYLRAADAPSPPPGSLHAEYMAAIAAVVRRPARTSQDKVVVTDANAARLRDVHNRIRHLEGKACIAWDCDRCVPPRDL